MKKFLIVLISLLPLFTFGQDKAMAISEYTELIRNNPYESINYVWRGKLYESIGQYEEAIADYNQAIRVKDDNDWYPNYIRGLYFITIANYEAALLDFNTSIRIQPNNHIESQFPRFFKRAMCYFVLDKLNEAIDDCNTSIAGGNEYTNKKTYALRGVAKKNKGLYFCRDFNRSCELGYQDACDMYYEDCK